MIQDNQVRNFEAGRDIQERLAQRGLLDCVELAVRVRERVAFLEGSVPNVIHKRTIEEVALTACGVSEVVNMLRVAPMAAVDDATLRMRLRRALAKNTIIDETRLSVEVTIGCVHVRGLARTAAERCAVENEVWAVAGVRGVTNEVQVLSEEDRGRRDVPEEIARAVAQDLGLSPTAVGVDFDRGTVRLHGEVAHEHHRVAVEEMAYWMPSVTDVVNELRVVPPPPLARDADFGQGSSSGLSHNQKGASGPLVGG